MNCRVMCLKIIFLGCDVVMIDTFRISYLKIILLHIKQQSIIKIIFLNALSVINMCPEYDDLKKHIETVLEKDKNIDCNQCNLSTRSKMTLESADR